MMLYGIITADPIPKQINMFLHILQKRRNKTASKPILSNRYSSEHCQTGFNQLKTPSSMGGQARFSLAYLSFGAYTILCRGRRMENTMKTMREMAAEVTRPAIIAVTPNCPDCVFASRIAWRMSGAEVLILSRGRLPLLWSVDPSYQLVGISEFDGVNECRRQC